jgi:hypothetical protein
MNMTAALYDVLANDATLVAMLQTYGGGSAPAIFTTDPAPGDATLPYIVAAGRVSDVAFDTKTTTGREVEQNIRCYAEADGSVDQVEAIAERVKSLLHRQPFSVVGGEMELVDVSGPVVLDEADVYGRIVMVRTITRRIDQ